MFTKMTFCQLVSELDNSIFFIEVEAKLFTTLIAGASVSIMIKLSVKVYETNSYMN